MAAVRHLGFGKDVIADHPRLVFDGLTPSHNCTLIVFLFARYRDFYPRNAQHSYTTQIGNPTQSIECTFNDLE